MMLVPTLSSLPLHIAMTKILYSFKAIWAPTKQALHKVLLESRLLAMVH